MMSTRRRPLYQEYDVIAIPRDIPELGVKRGDEGVIKGLSLRNETVVASVKVYYSTGQPKGLVGMRVTPDEEVLSCSPAA